MDFANFLVGIPTQSTADDLHVRAGAAPLRINTSPVLFLSPPIDREHDVADIGPDHTLSVTAVHQGFVFNPNRNDTELLMFVTPDDPTILSHLDVDLLHFRPYFRLAVSPMRTRHIRLWCKNFADSLIGQQFDFSLAFRSDPVLIENYNPSAEQDHPSAYSSGL